MNGSQPSAFPNPTIPKPATDPKRVNPVGGNIGDFGFETDSQRSGQAPADYVSPFFESIRNAPVTIISPEGNLVDAAAPSDLGQTLAEKAITPIGTVNFSEYNKKIEEQTKILKIAEEFGDKGSEEFFAPVKEIKQDIPATTGSAEQAPDENIVAASIKELVDFKFFFSHTKKMVTTGWSLLFGGLKSTFKSIFGIEGKKKPAPKDQKEADKMAKKQKQNRAKRIFFDSLRSMAGLITGADKRRMVRQSLMDTNPTIKMGNTLYEGVLEGSGLNVYAQTEKEKALAEAERKKKQKEAQMSIAQSKGGKGVDLNAIAEGGTGKGGVNISTTGGGGAG